MPDLREHLQTALGDSYVIEREIGGGGMGRVFLVRDESLGRRIVVKVLPPSDGADMSVERFKREIQFAARLQHANIVPLLTAGDAAGSPYYSMPFVDGESLRARLASGPLPIGDVVSTLKDVARALAFAHAQGVVHRDIKPENVLVSGGAAVVADFGIAKALSEARTGVGNATLTSAGTALGTPAYMAPEQATGDPGTNHRADIYSFGCMAYELLTGQQPFQGTAAHRVIAQHLTDAPPLVLARRPDCPRPLALLVARCLEKDPDRRPQSASEIVEVLDSVATLSGASTNYAVTAGGRKWIAGGGLAGIAVAMSALFVTTRDAPDAGVQTLTVLPFVAIGGDSAHEYLADGITEEIATTLSKTRGVRVVGRTAANRFRGRRDIDVRAVGESLGVALVVQGSVRRTDAGLRVSAQLTDTKTGEEIWADGYQRGASELMAVRDEISRAVVGRLRERSGDVGRVATTSVGSSNAEAYDLYLHAVYLLRRRAIGQATEAFERAIARDPGFARAHAGLSTTLALYPYFTGTPPTVVHDRLVKAASQALSLDSTLSEPHTALGLAHMHKMDWVASQRAHELAVSLDPSDPEAHLQYARLLLYMGYADSALAEFRRARAIDPHSALYTSWIGGVLWMQRQEAQARAEIERALEQDSLNAVAVHYASRLYLEIGDTAQARRFAMRMPRFPPWAGSVAYVLARVGHRAAADSIRRVMDRERPWSSNIASAYASLGLGDTTAALNSIDRAQKAGEFWPVYFTVADRAFESLKGSSRFRALVRSTGLTDRALEPE